MAGPVGLVAIFLIAAAVLAAGIATIRLWPLFDTRGIDLQALSDPPPQTTHLLAADVAD
jgi:hypothetical protein